MKTFSIHSGAREAVNHAIFIIGPGRTGSTLLGKIVHSLRPVAYAYEPPLLHSLMPLIDELREDQFRVLFETYLYEVELMGQITGRAWNFNRNDESCIYHVKTEAEVNARMGKSWTKVLAVEEAKKVRLAVKITDVVGFLPKLLGLYPGLIFLVTHRGANGFIQSVLTKKWFSDETLKRRDIFWQGRTHRGFVVPHWIAEEDSQRWIDWPEIERIGHYYVHMLEKSAELRNATIVSYDELAGSPAETVARLAEKLGLEFGARTDQIVSDIHAPRSIETDWVSQLPVELRHAVKSFSDPDDFRRRLEHSGKGEEEPVCAR